MSSSCSNNRLIMGPTSNRINMELLKCIIRENSSGETVCAEPPLMKMDKDLITDSDLKILSIKDNSITSNYLSQGSVNNSKIALNTIRPDKLAKPMNEDGITTSDNKILLYNGDFWEYATPSAADSGVNAIKTDSNSGLKANENPDTREVVMCVTNEGITESKLAGESVTTDKIANKSIVPEKFAEPYFSKANKPWPAIFLFVNGIIPRWTTKYLRFFWNPVGGLLEEIEIDPETGEALENPEVKPNSIIIKNFENLPGSNESAIMVKGMDPEPENTEQNQKTALFVESGTSTMESNCVQPTLNLKNNMITGGNKAPALNIYDNAIKVGDAKYFFPLIQKGEKGHSDHLIGKSLIVQNVNYDKETDSDDYIANVYFGYSS